MFQLQSCLIFLCSLSGLTVLCSLTFTPPQKLNLTNINILETLRTNWSNWNFVVWVVCLPSALFGYFVPFVHLVAYAESLLLDPSRASSLLAVIAITSGAGRLVFGKLSDLAFFNKEGNRIYLQQVRDQCQYCQLQSFDSQAALFCLGICTMLLTTATQAGDHKFEVLLSICCLLGLSDGCFITLLGPIAFDLCGPAGACQAIGCLLSLFSLPATVGPPVAGIIHDKVSSAGHI